MQNFTLTGQAQNMSDGSVATAYEYNATLPNNALIFVSIIYYY